jgi:U3 small nucleolar RNA-associated protein 13
VSHDERTVVSAAADSVITFWQDCTEEQEEEKETKRADLVLKWAAFFYVFGSKITTLAESKIS